MQLVLVECFVSYPGSSEKSRRLVRHFAASAGSRFLFKKRRQLFVRSHNETFSVVSLRVSNPDSSPLGINGSDAAQLQPALLHCVRDEVGIDSAFAPVTCHPVTALCRAKTEGCLSIMHHHD